MQVSGGHFIVILQIMPESSNHDGLKHVLNHECSSTSFCEDPRALSLSAIASRFKLFKDPLEPIIPIPNPGDMALQFLDMPLSNQSIDFMEIPFHDKKPNIVINHKSGERCEGASSSHNAWGFRDPVVRTLKPRTFQGKREVRPLLRGYLSRRCFKKG